MGDMTTQTEGTEHPAPSTERMGIYVALQRAELAERRARTTLARTATWSVALFAAAWAFYLVIQGVQLLD